MLFSKIKNIKWIFTFCLIGIIQISAFAQDDEIDQFNIWDTAEVRYYIENSGFDPSQKYELWEHQTIKARSLNDHTAPYYFRKEMEAIPEFFDDKTKVVKYTRYSVFATNRYILDNALSYAYKAEDIAENVNDDFMRGKVSHALGWYYAANCDYERAHRTYDKAIAYFKSSNFPTGVRNTMVKKGIAYQLVNKNKEALKTFQEVYNLKNREITRNDLALLIKSTIRNRDTITTLSLLDEYYKKVKKKNPNGPFSNQYYLIKSIEANIQKNDSLELSYLIKARNYARKLNQPKEIFSALMSLGKFHYENDRIDIAKKNFKRASAISYANLMHNRFNEPLEYLIKIAQYQYEHFEEMEYRDIQKNYFNVTQQKISVNNIIENNQKSILTRQKREIQSQNQKIWILTAMGFIGLGLLLFSFFYFRKYKKIVEDLSNKNNLLDESVHEKQTLLQETHHRVKNNLQIIASLLNLQRKYTKDRKLTTALIDGRNRVKSMALIHQLLYQKKDLKGINIRNYVENLMSSLFGSLKADAENIQFINEVDPLNLHEDTLLAIGLIINEIVTNSLKYAFNDKEDGVIKIKLKKVENKLFLSVSDNGNGMPEDFNINDKASFGYSLITSLSKKLDATITIEGKEGTTVNFEILKFIET